MTKKTSKKTAKVSVPKARKRSQVKKSTATQPVSGDQIRRTFKGREMVIDVIDGQFIHEGQTFTSLSALAKSIVGYGISGPHFFRMAMPRPGKLTGGK